jgi:hypothetical protein
MNMLERRPWDEDMVVLGRTYRCGLMIIKSVYVGLASLLTNWRDRSTAT